MTRLPEMFVARLEATGSEIVSPPALKADSCGLELSALVNEPETEIIANVPSIRMFLICRVSLPCEFVRNLSHRHGVPLITLRACFMFDQMSHQNMPELLTSPSYKPSVGFGLSSETQQG